jgi:hypothetical protein
MKRGSIHAAVTHVRRHAIAYLALFAAVGGGTAIAAKKIKLPKGSVGAKQLKAGAVDSSKVANGSLKAEDLAPGTIPGATAGTPAAPAPTEVVERTFRETTSTTSDILLAAPAGLGEVEAACNTGDPATGLVQLNYNNTSSTDVNLVQDGVYENGINDQRIFSANTVAAGDALAGDFVNFRAQRHQLELISEEASPRAATVIVTAQTGNASCRFHVITLGG